MITKGFTGSAGAGKTTRLLRDLDTYLAEHPLGQSQRVLALTFMHGSRHRLAERLANCSAKRHYDCMTLDRFAWDICRRWRSRLRVSNERCPVDLEALNYDTTCEAAVSLLASSDVVKWVTARYPVIVLDEFQDCAPVRLALAQRLHGFTTLLIAADDFQNLNLTCESPGVAWLRQLGVCEDLSGCWRTTDTDLIAAAQALRAGTSLPSNTSTSFKLISSPSAHVAASYISQTMAQATANGVVLISAAREGTSPWVDEVIQLVRTKQYGKQKAGPVQIKWETASERMIEETVGALGVEEPSKQILASEIHALPKTPLSLQLKRWAEHERRVLGNTVFRASDVRSQIMRASQQFRSLGTTKHSRYCSMTIHQAKNREFNVVIVLWPFQVVSDPLLQRRLLYNAITRAKRRAIVIVHDPKKSRVTTPPFQYPD